MRLPEHEQCRYALRNRSGRGRSILLHDSSRKTFYGSVKIKRTTQKEKNMEFEKAKELFKKNTETMAAYSHAMGVLSYDSETAAPKIRRKASAELTAS